jgi:CRP-like cAMP-binding protein
MLGKLYGDGQTIVRQGDTGDCMYVVQEGEVEVLREDNGESVRLAILEAGDFFGEMALFDHDVRSATVRAMGEARVLTVDRRTLLRRFQEDPSLALRIVDGLIHRVRELDAEVARLSGIAAHG